MVSVGETGVIIDNYLAIDRFANNPNVKYRFLSSAHSHLCRKLTSKWEADGIYCSPITAKLLPIVTKRREAGYGIQKKWIWPLNLNVWHKMDGFSVMLIDANHAPGAVMFIFEGERLKAGRVLYTGYFRADAKFYQNTIALSALQERRFDVIYFDSTYIDLMGGEFPSRKSAAMKAVNVLRMLSYDGVAAKGGVAIPVPIIGREEFLIDIAKELNCRIWLHPERFEIASILGISDYFSETKKDTFIWTCSPREKEEVMFMTNSHMIRASMVQRLSLKKEINSEREHTIWYSDHCSPAELRSFFSVLSFAQVIGITNRLPASVENELEKLSLSGTMDFQRVNTFDYFKKNDQDPEMLINPSLVSWRVGLAFEYAFREFCELLATEQIVDLTNLISAENIDGEMSALSLELGDPVASSTTDKQRHMKESGKHDRSATEQRTNDAPDITEPNRENYSLRNFLINFFNRTVAGSSDWGQRDVEMVDDSSLDEAEPMDVDHAEETSQNSRENSSRDTAAEFDMRILEQQIDVPTVLESLTKELLSQISDCVDKIDGKDAALMEFVSDMDISEAFRDFDDFYEQYLEQNREAYAVGPVSMPYNIKDHVCYDPSNAPMLPNIVSELLDDSSAEE